MNIPRFLYNSKSDQKDSPDREEGYEKRTSRSRNKESKGRGNSTRKLAAGVRQEAAVYCFLPPVSLFSLVSCFLILTSGHCFDHFYHFLVTMDPCYDPVSDDDVKDALATFEVHLSRDVIGKRKSCHVVFVTVLSFHFHRQSN